MKNDSYRIAVLGSRLLLKWSAAAKHCLQCWSDAAKSSPVGEVPKPLFDPSAEA